MMSRTKRGSLSHEDAASMSREYYGYALHCIAKRFRDRGIPINDPDMVTLVAHDAIIAALRTYDGRMSYRIWLAAKCRYAVLDYMRSRQTNKARLSRATPITNHIEAEYCAKWDRSCEREEQAEEVAAVLSALLPRAFAAEISERYT